VEIAEQLARLNADISSGVPHLERGRVRGGPRDCHERPRPVIAALARVTPGDIDRAAEALKGAERWRIHTFISTSDIHMADMLR